MIGDCGTQIRDSQKEILDGVFSICRQKCPSRMINEVCVLPSEEIMLEIVYMICSTYMHDETEKHSKNGRWQMKT